MSRPVVLLLGPHRAAVSGVSTHLNLLLDSSLADEYDVVHFQVGSEGRDEGLIGKVLRLLAHLFGFVHTSLLVENARELAGDGRKEIPFAELAQRLVITAKLTLGSR